jgi:hypothetical protein
MSCRRLEETSDELSEKINRELNIYEVACRRRLYDAGIQNATDSQARELCGGGGGGGGC